VSAQPARAPARGSLADAHHEGLGRIEAALVSLDRKLDQVVEDAAVARTEIAWLKWGTRLLFAAVMGVGGLTAGEILAG
jgi:hypothetical protein